jgi:hypothetical protein
MESLQVRAWNWILSHRLEVALLLVFTAVGIQYANKAMQNRGAITRWREQLQDIEEGENIYKKGQHPNPPITALVLRPIAELPPFAGAMLWFVLKAGMAFLVIHWVFYLVETPGQPFPLWAKGVAILLSIRPIVGDLSHGNINLYVLFLVVAALVAYRRGRDWLGGGLLGLSIATKVTPLLFVPYFIYKRSWKMLAGCLAGLVVFTWVVPGLLLGWQENAELFTSWRKQMIDPFVLGGKVAYSDHHNQSLPGVVARLATESPSFTFFASRKNPVPSERWYHNLLSLDPKAADRLFVKTGMLLFAIGVMWSCRTPTRGGLGWRLTAEFSLVVLGMLIFSERTWKHHCVVLILPFSVLAYYLATCRPGPWLKRYLIATLAGALLSMSLTSTSLMGQELGKLGQVYGCYLWATFLLSAAMVVVLRTTPASVAAAGGAQQEASSQSWPGLRVGQLIGSIQTKK